LSQLYNEPTTGFRLNHPSEWITAIKRSPQRDAKSETLFVVGNFKDVDSVSVSRQLLDPDSTLAETLEAPETTPEQLVAELTAAQASTSGVLRFAVLGAEWLTLEDGRIAVRYEWRQETCRGRKIEGARGELFCVGMNDDTSVQTIKRHTTAVTILHTDGYLYSCIGSASENRWELVSPVLKAAVDSFGI